MRFPYPGEYMFHAHKTEFAELGWMGFFEVELMEARTRRRTRRERDPDRLPAWLLGAIPLALIVGALVALLTLGGDTLGERRGPPVEDIAVERTVLRPGEIELTIRNAGPDPVDVAQVFVNDAYVDFTETDAARSDRLGSEHPDARLPVAGGLAATDHDADLDRGDDRARDRRSRSRRPRPTAASTG